MRTRNCRVRVKSRYSYYPLEQGVEEERLRAVGNGFDKLLDTMNPYAHINRRVEFVNQEQP